MKKHWRVILASIFGFAVILCWFVQEVEIASGISEDNFRRVSIGMNVDEVRDILGKENVRGGFRPGRTVLRWNSKEFWLEVWFDDKTRLVEFGELCRDTGYVELLRRHNTWDLILRWLHLAPRRQYPIDL